MRCFSEQSAEASTLSSSSPSSAVFVARLQAIRRSWKCALTLSERSKRAIVLFLSKHRRSTRRNNALQVDRELEIRETTANPLAPLKVNRLR